MRRAALFAGLAATALALPVVPASAASAASVSFDCRLHLPTFPGKNLDRVCLGAAAGGGTVEQGGLTVTWAAGRAEASVDTGPVRVRVSAGTAQARFELAEVDDTGGCHIGSAYGVLRVEPVTVAASDGTLGEGVLTVPLVWVRLGTQAEVRTNSATAAPASISWRANGVDRTVNYTSNFRGRIAWVPAPTMYADHGCPLPSTNNGPLNVRVVGSVAT